MNSVRDEILLDTLIGTLCQKLPFLAEKYQEESLGVLGSYVHNSQRDDSDLDLLVTFRLPPSPLKFIQVENYLSDSLGVKVDLVMKDVLKPRIGSRILNEFVHL